MPGAEVQNGQAVMGGQIELYACRHTTFGGFKQSAGSNSFDINAHRRHIRATLIECI